MRQFHVIESNFCPKIYRLFTKIKRKYGILEKMIVLYAIIIGKVWRGDVEPHHFAANGVCQNCGCDSNSDRYAIAKHRFSIEIRCGGAESG